MGLECLPTFTIKNQQNVGLGKRTIHGSYGYGSVIKMQDFPGGQDCMLGAILNVVILVVTISFATLHPKT